jgi:hypothetical protein
MCESWVSYVEDQSCNHDRRYAVQVIYLADRTRSLGDRMDPHIRKCGSNAPGIWLNSIKKNARRDPSERENIRCQAEGHGSEIVLRNSVG